MFSVQSMNVNARLYIYGFTQLRLARVITTELAPHVYLQVCSSRQEEHNDNPLRVVGALPVSLTLLLLLQAFASVVLFSDLLIERGQAWLVGM